ncbi:type I secretion system permease/ATPase, partial [Rhizobiaceae sp. 2RAB30]
LAIGAYLVVRGEATGGIMIAAPIMMTRALAPNELAIAHWKGFISARQSWSRLKQLLALLPETPVSIELKAPQRMLSVENVTVVPPGDRKLVVQDVAFNLE